NQNCVKKQLEKFLDFDASKANAAVMVNNYDWFKEMKFLEFIRDVGKHITVNYMMAKDSVKKRIESDSGISFTEFTYQLIQGYDFYFLYKTYNCKLQMGGSDQWGNITTGTELIRRKTGGEAFAFTCPLLTKADGGKFGKTEKGNVWLDAAKTSPYHFYQFWLNAADDDAKKWIKIFTFLPPSEIDTLIEQHGQNASQRLLQKTLAREITLFVHDEEGLQQALETTEKLFANQNAPAESLSEDDLQNLEGIVQVEYAAGALAAGIDAVSFLADTKILPSKSEARKMLQNGGISINRNKVSDAQMKIDASLLLHNKYLLVQKGRKNYYLVKVVE
ncbi:MAG TPA: tyrosine--tRNA ligase, partial [Chitinophagaceae bacterium]|nr:tyrosine--tRNA ligase [Chitinophagaceae bacterium]